MGVQFQIALMGEDDALLESIARVAFAEVDRLESILNNWDRDSAVSRFNAAAGTEWIEVPRELATVVVAAKEMHRSTRGAYDITILPALVAYGFDSPPIRIPGEAERTELERNIGSEKLAVGFDPPRLRRSIGGLQIDVSSASKGFVVDEIAKRLRERGVTNAFIGAGASSVCAIGDGPGGHGWPFQLDDATTWNLVDESVSTSGSSTRDLVLGAEQIGHIFDARTLRPAQRRVEMACIRGPSGMFVDMASTALVVLGDVEGEAWFVSDPAMREYRAWMRLRGDAAPVEFGASGRQ